MLEGAVVLLKMLVAHKALVVLEEAVLAQHLVQPPVKQIRVAVVVALELVQLVEQVAPVLSS
jgi:hypothetical protein